MPKRKTSRKLPPAAPRSLRGSAVDGLRRRGEGVQAPQRREIDLPKIFVRVPPPSGRYGWRYAQARIVLRRRRYRYLVWKEQGRKRMLYLGKVKICALLAAGPPGAGELARAIAEGGKK